MSAATRRPKADPSRTEELRERKNVLAKFDRFTEARMRSQFLTFPFAF